METEYSSPLDVYVGWAKHHRWGAGTVYNRPPARYYCIWLVMNGPIEANIVGKTWRFEKGQACLLPPDFAGMMIAPQGAEWLSIGLRITTLEGADWLRDRKLPITWAPEKSTWRYMYAWMRQLYELEQRRETIDPLIRYGLGNALLGSCLPYIGSGQSALPRWLPPVLEQIHRDPEISIAVLATDAGYSTAQFRHLFHKYMGTSPRGYVRRYRLEQARRLLESSDAPIHAIAEQLGFDNASHFTRFFVQTSGVTPSHHRKISRLPNV